MKEKEVVKIMKDGGVEVCVERMNDGGVREYVERMKDGVKSILKESRST